MLPLPRAAAKPAAFVLDVLLRAAVDLLVHHRRDNHDQHLLVNVDSRYSSHPVFLSARKRQDARKFNIRTVTRLSPFLADGQYRKDWFIHASRAKLVYGLNISRAVSASAVPRPSPNYRA